MSILSIRDGFHLRLCPFGIVSIRDRAHLERCPLVIVPTRDGDLSVRCPVGIVFIWVRVQDPKIIHYSVYCKLSFCFILLFPLHAEKIYYNLITMHLIFASLLYV